MANVKNEKAAAQPKSAPKRGAKRKGRGRPVLTEQVVGRDALLQIAGELLRTTPPESVTRLMVAQAAQVDPALIRYYFGTVDHLITEVVVDHHRRIHQSLMELMEGGRSLDWIKGRIGHMIDLFIENPYQHTLIRQVMYKERNTAEHRVWYDALRASIQYTQSQIDLGVKQGMIRSVDPRLLHLALVGVGEIFGANPEVVSDTFDGQETVTSLRDRYVDFIYDLFYNGLRAT